LIVHLLTVGLSNALEANVFNVVGTILYAALDYDTGVPHLVSGSGEVSMIVLIHSDNASMNLVSSDITSDTVIEKVAVSLGAGCELLEDECLSVTFTRDRSSHDSTSEVMLVRNPVNIDRSKERMLFPSILPGLEIGKTNGALENGVSINSLRNTGFVISKGSDEAGKLFLLLADDVKHLLLGI
jgi:hypothetical protein